MSAEQQGEPRPPMPPTDSANAASPDHPADTGKPASTDNGVGPDPRPVPGPVPIPVTLQVNGEPREIPAGLNLTQALEALGYHPRLVVVEFNGTILARERWADQPVVETDVLEVVTIVGGGS